ncbi:armadillo-type protein [Chaetomium fimeti]|uniref:Armadillo-type protein n=1 Tax=Chaetomium fimeti TaxID=1854472 RepID=A0AAE0HN99_9PEZI|nr:armadillo-type protein [Chaetomium fimeti]
MISVNLSSRVFLATGTTALCILAGTTAVWLWLSHPEPPSPSLQFEPKQRGVRLCQVNDKDDSDADIDIIAIHGLDTKSPDTWTWGAKNAQQNVNWLADPDMLPSKVGAARIFTCNWPADLLQPADLVPKRIEEYALLLLNAIDRELFVADATRKEPRRLFFIASCLGGIVLTKALVDADDKYLSLRKATCGIVFLATPFRGTSFRDVAAFAEPGLQFLASIRGREVNKLLDKVKGSTFDLETLVREFTQLCQDKDHPCLVFTFYEKGKTSLPLKVFPWLPSFFRQEKQLVDESSATLDIVHKPLPLDRRHVMMNKFHGPGCADYKTVAGKIQEFLRKIREGTPLIQADAWIRTEHYTTDRLKIERLSGDPLPMDQCYINLAIVEQYRSEEESKTQSSPFSLSARLKIETLYKNIQVELPTLFRPRKRGDVQTNPRRILIRGRAGVGKTTLCKKIVHEFTHGTWGQWDDLFDRVLWVPLRNLKLDERRQAQYHFVDLFTHEYFSDPPKPNLASALSDTLEWTESSRTLFLLDGLDEVSQELGDQSVMFHFLKKLLNQPNVIITSRPSGKLPPGLKAIDIELETIGFYPDQVNEYLEQVLPGQAEDIRSFLQARPLVRDLVRVPIQLDAFSFTWNESVTKLDTMTAVYQGIEDGLWKKDVLRLGKRHDGKLLTEGLIQDSDPSEIRDLVRDEICFLEGLAFTGLHNDVIDFDPRHQKAMSTHFSPAIILPSKTLPHLSFLRTSNLSPRKGNHNQSYHFLHLTYQEYFAARYFVRQWQAGEPLKCRVLGNGKLETLGTGDFLRKHKYTARYDIFWRFVAGLFDAERKGEEFFHAIEDKPRDLLGPTHQRLVMHCLSETLMETRPRRSLEKRLKEWLLFEFEFTKKARSASEVEFPERALVDALQEAPFPVKMTILESLAIRPTLPSSIVDIIVSWLEDGQSEPSRTMAFEVLRRFSLGRGLSDDLLTAVVERVLHKTEHWSVRIAVLQLLRAQPTISDEHLPAVIELALCKYEDESIRTAALEALPRQLKISGEHLTAMVDLALCRDEGVSIRTAALEVLPGQLKISGKHLTAVIELALCKDEHESIRTAALEVLPRQLKMSGEHLTAVLELALCKDEDVSIRTAALEVPPGQLKISGEHLAAVVELALSKDEDKSVRCNALSTFARDFTISDERFTAVVELALCKDEDRAVRKAALGALETQPSISDDFLTAVVGLLGDKDDYMREAALTLLRAQPSLSDDRLTAVVEVLKDNDSLVRRAALDVLQAQPRLSDEHLMAVLALLEVDNNYTKTHVLKVLQAQPNISDEHIAVVVGLLEDSHELVRSAALKVLEEHPMSISNEQLKVVVALLQSWNEYVRQAASRILQRQPSLSDECLKALSLLLAFENGGGPAEVVLRGHEEFYSTLLSGPSARSLYSIHFARSFEEQWSWYVEDGALCVNAPDGIRKGNIDNMEAFVDMVRKSRPRGFPSTGEEM